MASGDATSSALDVIIGEYFREYQKDFLTDWSNRRLVLKARRVGLSEVAAFDVVMTSSGLWERFGAPVHTHNYSIISKRDTEAQQFIRYCKRWVDILGTDPALAPWVELGPDAATALGFKRSGRRIQSDTQSEMAGRGQEGHLLKDEAAWYKHARAIVAGADKIPLSDDRLRLTEFSTPNGTSGMGEVFWRKWTDTDKFGHYSRHEVTIWRAIDDGFPITVEQARANCFTEDEFHQEFGCQFVAEQNEYFTREMLERQHEEHTPSGPAEEVVVGVDVASVSDLTAVVVLKRWGKAMYVTDSYVISGVPYATGAERGQDEIVSALLCDISPDRAVVDASGDGAELFGRLLARRPCELVAHSYHRGGRQWKETWVPRIRGEFEKGFMHVTDFRPQVYDRSTGKWRKHHYPQLLYDFLKIKRKHLATGITFDSPRGKDGHGDAFWALAQARSRMTGKTAAQANGEFRRLLDAATGGSDPAYSGYL